MPEMDFVTGSGVFTDGVPVLDAPGMNGAAVIEAHVIGGVLFADAVPFDSTRARAGRVACTVCSGPFTGGGDDNNFVARNIFSNLVVLKPDFISARSPSNGTPSSNVI